LNIKSGCLTANSIIPIRMSHRHSVFSGKTLSFSLHFFEHPSPPLLNIPSRMPTLYYRTLFLTGREVTNSKILEVLVGKVVSVP
jgi:hypothetical protein